MSSVVVLLGAPGSGKSAVGAELAALGLRWREWELAIVTRWGSRENFVANKTTALEVLHDEMRAFIASPDTAAAIETTGLSDAGLLDELSREHRLFVVRLDVSQAEAARRIEQRAPDRHLTDDIDSNRAISQAFYETVAPRRRADLVIDTERTSPRDAAATIMEAMGSVSTGKACSHGGVRTCGHQSDRSRAGGAVPRDVRSQRRAARGQIPCPWRSHPCPRRGVAAGAPRHHRVRVGRSCAGLVRVRGLSASSFGPRRSRRLADGRRGRSLLTDDAERKVMTYQGYQGHGETTTDATNRRRRLSGGTIASLSGVGVLVVFMIQNTENVAVDFLFWSFTWPLWLLILVAALVGAFVWFGLGVLRRHRRRTARRVARRNERG